MKNKKTTWALIVLALIALWYFLWYKPRQAKTLTDVVAENLPAPPPVIYDIPNEKYGEIIDPFVNIPTLPASGGRKKDYDDPRMQQLFG